MWIYNTFAALAVLASAVPIRAANHAVNIDSIYFPDDSVISISKRQVNKNLNLVYQNHDRIVENRHSVASQRQQPQSFNPPARIPIPTSPSSQLIPTTLQSSQSYNYDPITDFAWSTFKGSKISNPIGNLILCPLLVQLILSQIEVAAVGNTKDEIRTVIRNVDPKLLARLVYGIKSTKFRNEINLASAIFSSRNMGLNATFVQESRSRDVSIQPVDFGNTNEALYIINNWISAATKNHIRNLFKPDHLYGLKVLLTNTMYFRGIWKTAFNESQTTFDRFDTTDKLNRGIAFMNKVEKLRGSEFESGGGAKGTWIELPYEGNEFSMVLILPEIRHTLDHLIRQLTSADIANIIGQLEEPYKRLVYLKMPKFSIQSSFSLTNVLLKMGLVNLFTTQSQLPYLTNNHEPVAVSDVLQHTVLNVDEYGSVATAATLLSVVTLSLDGMPRELVFVANQPFLAIIVDKRSRVPLFVAKIFDP
ncbi:plasminogen activator inhibitor 1-like isoform X1 [Bradysia coprophila]|uniref:plasminogen activator inhibitor 1-like isoform X1 n=1 Tax=Bradysia coprophila TaxID=38358 RepID=UPI00187DD545|nr:plasminogen activator inhibitor 1-like isoform X1 [Bradysia coprophila]